MNSERLVLFYAIARAWHRDTGQTPGTVNYIERKIIVPSIQLEPSCQSTANQKTNRNLMGDGRNVVGGEITARS